MAKKKSKKKLFILIGFLIVAAVVITWVVTQQTDKTIKVKVEKAGRRTIIQTVTATGRIQPETEVKISSEASGEIIFLGVKEGDTVLVADVLVKIKPDIIETQLEQYHAAAEASKMEIEIRKAELKRSKASLKRIKDLYEKEFASQEELDQYKAVYDQANSSYKASLSRYTQSLASLKQIERNADRTTIYAPQNGIITKLDIEKGEKVVGTELMEGTAMMIISDLNTMNAEVEVDENDIILVEVGDTSRIEIDAFPDSIYTGVVIEIGHSALQSALGTQDQVTNFKVKIRMIDIEPRLRPGMSCSADIETETRENVIAIPLQAVTVRASERDSKSDESESETDNMTNEEEDKKKNKRPQSVVFLKDGAKAKKVEVETGVSDNGYIEILVGIEEDDEIISGSFIAVSKELENGSMIRVDSTKHRRKFGKKK